MKNERDQEQSDGEHAERPAEGRGRGRGRGRGHRKGRGRGKGAGPSTASSSKDYKDVEQAAGCPPSKRPRTQAQHADSLRAEEEQAEKGRREEEKKHSKLDQEAGSCFFEANGLGRVKSQGVNLWQAKSTAKTGKRQCKAVSEAGSCK